MKRVAVIVYHKNASKLYPKKWLDTCVFSILNQSYRDFDIFELNYGGEDERIFDNIPPYIGYTFINRKCQNFVDGMNLLLNTVFASPDYFCCMNVNIDDYYSMDRFEKQVAQIRSGSDLVSSNIMYVDEHGQTKKFLHFSGLNIKKELQRGNNIIAHPAVCYSRNFWLNCGGYNINAIPQEDFILWKRTMHRFKFHILSDFLCYHRIHANKVCQNPNNR